MRKILIWCLLDPEPRLPSRRLPAWFGRTVCSAGTRPKITPVRIETKNANNRTPGLKAISLTRGRSDGASFNSAVFISATVLNATAPETAESKMLSASNCPISRAFPAPSASRTAISR